MDVVEFFNVFVNSVEFGILVSLRVIFVLYVRVFLFYVSVIRIIM